MFLIYIVKCPCVFFSQTSTYFPYFSIDICVLRSLGTGTIYWFGEGDMHEDRTQADNNEIAIVPGVGIVLILNFCFPRRLQFAQCQPKKKTEPESTHEYLVFVSPKRIEPLVICECRIQVGKGQFIKRFFPVFQHANISQSNFQKYDHSYRFTWENIFFFSSS